MNKADDMESIINLDHTEGDKGSEPEEVTRPEFGASTRSSYSKPTGAAPVCSPTMIMALLVSGLIIAFITVIILAVTVGNVKAEEKKYAQPYPSLCASTACLQESSEVVNIMNQSANPCQDFFSFTCGNFAKMNPGSNVDPFSVLSAENTNKMIAALQQPINDSSASSYERKLKEFFESCINDYQNTENGGTPLINDINSNGGWNAFYTFQNSTWNFGTTLQALQDKFGVSPFFSIDVNLDYERDRKEYVIEMNVPTLGMGSWYYYVYNNSLATNHKAGYTAYIKTVIQLLWTDGASKPPQSASTLNQTANDVMAVETAIANNIYHTTTVSNNYRTIEYIQQTYGGIINFETLLTNHFIEARVNKDTMIHFHEENYMKAITNTLKTLSRRQLNNYMMWILSMNFADDLGWSYIHATRDWAEIKYNGYVTFVGTFNWCFMLSQRHLTDGINALYVQDYYNGGSNDMDDAIFNSIRSALITDLPNLQWMDAATRQTAKSKLGNITAHIGYPPFLDSKATMNQIYAELAINRQNVQYKNMVAIYTWETSRDCNKLIKQKLTTDDWPSEMWSTNYYYDTEWNSIFIPAGVLQDPIYNIHIPMFMNFGSFGRLCGYTLVETIDTYGANYDSFGNYGNWWSKPTQQNFMQQVQMCDEKAWKGEMFDGYNMSVLETQGYPYKPFETLAKFVWRETAALKYSLSAYQYYVSLNGMELALPGLQTDTNDEGLMISWAQTFCYTHSDYMTLVYLLYYGDEAEKLIVEPTLRGNKHFTDIYKCRAGTYYVDHPFNCPGF